MSDNKKDEKKNEGQEEKKPEGKMINGVLLKEADTKAEKMLLGIIEQKAGHIKFGEIEIKIKIRDGEMIQVINFVAGENINLGSEFNRGKRMS